MPHFLTLSSCQQNLDAVLLQDPQNSISLCIFFFTPSILLFYHLPKKCLFENSFDAMLALPTNTQSCKQYTCCNSLLKTKNDARSFAPLSPVLFCVHADAMQLQACIVLNGNRGIKYVQLQLLIDNLSRLSIHFQNSPVVLNDFHRRCIKRER